MTRLLILITILFSLPVEAKRVMMLKENFRVKEGKQFVEYYLSTDTAISPKDRYLEMKAGTSPSVKRYLFVTTQSQKWLYFKMKNPQEQPVDLLIEMGDFGLSKADYYVFLHDTIVLSGDIAKRGGLRTGSYYDRKIIIPFQAMPGLEYHFLIQVHTSAPLFDLPVVFWNKRSKMIVSPAIEFGRGIFYGVLSFFILVTGFVVYLIRQRSYFFYWLYLSLGGILLVLKSGIPLEVFWPGRSYFDFIITNFFLFAYLIVTLQFLKEFLSYRTAIRWHITIIHILTGTGVLLMLAYIPFSYFRAIWQDVMMIIQTIYINLTNLAVVAIIFYYIPKISERAILIVALLYYLIFSAYLFNPFIEFGFWTGQSIGHVIIYSGGLAIGVLLITITALRIKNVFEKNRELKRQLSDLNRSYSYSLIEGQEKERRRVAEELHDGIGAHLSAVKMRLSSIKANLSEMDEQEGINRIIENLDESCLQVREMSHELMPPSLMRFGLAASLKDMTRQYQQTFPIRIYLRNNLHQTSLDDMSQVVLYRLMHQLYELMVHQHCKQVDIKLIVLPSVEKAEIRITYTGGTPQLKAELKNGQLFRLVELLQGRMDTVMSNIWDDEINIEIPVVIPSEKKEE
jgi:two-component system, NarL family, sensor kinase